MRGNLCNPHCTLGNFWWQFFVIFHQYWQGEHISGMRRTISGSSSGYSLRRARLETTYVADGNLRPNQLRYMLKRLGMALFLNSLPEYEVTHHGRVC